MAHIDGGFKSTVEWAEITGLTDGTTYSVQNVGQRTVYLLELDSQTAPDDDDFQFASHIYPGWSQRIMPESSFFYVKSAVGANVLSISEAI